MLDKLRREIIQIEMDLLLNAEFRQECQEKLEMVFGPRVERLEKELEELKDSHTYEERMRRKKVKEELNEAKKLYNLQYEEMKKGEASREKMIKAKEVKEQQLEIIKTKFK